ncbi:MAG: DUF305 domain-containing protein [Brevundimonas sp.]|jgi:uncharacterized protein (DUF305 family)|uniref:DUF305 domain-containing protein n=1 Tax=unclassified Brevundimonas TaxID=2622653 RepID=UPI0006FA1558|nr:MULTISPECIES: DUF305 domain-containing protein [unclassified Brevundimonas]KQP48011.1 hypothetical protein ASF31_01305 [Brevundimonas sp. Leaf280]KQR56935.1 hypothetical protein ASF81_05030 [Brevundimonas sp. Leaf168]
MIRVLTPLALLGLLSACDGGGDPVQQALRDTSAANQAAAARTTEQMEAAGHAGHDMGGSTPGDKAFAASEAEMHRKMAAASGQTIDQAYVAKMIAHHEGAVAMAKVALRDSRDPEIRRMAQSVVDTQTREIAEMKAWAPTAPPAN